METPANGPGPDRIQSAVALGRIKNDAAAEALVRLAVRKDADQFLRAAVLSSINADNVVAAMKSALNANAPPDFVKPLVASAVGFGKESQLGFLGKLDAASGPTAFAALEGLLQGLKRKRGSAIHLSLTETVDYAVASAVDPNAKLDRRLCCLRLFGWLRGASEKESAALAKLLDQDDAPSIQTAAIEAASRLGSSAAYRAVVRNWARLSPSQRRAAIDMLLQTHQGVSILVASLESKALPATDLDALGRGKLLQQSESAIRERAARLFEPLLKNREAVVAGYKNVDDRHGDAERGKVVFGKNCAGCHRLDEAGFAVGPDLATVALKPANYLLMEILDPNRNLDARYVGYTVLAGDGRTLTGLLAGESDSSLTLLGQDGRRTELLRSDVERIAASGKSLMPEGLEQQIPPSQMADLLAYVRRRLPPPKSFHGNTPKPIALEEGRFSLPARFAELRGPTIRFVVPQFAAEYWESMEDFAAWQIEVAEPGIFNVEFEYGCPENAAGNSFVLECDGKTIRGKTSSTGGWEQYKRKRIGEIEIGAGRRRLSLKPAGEKLNKALFDLRAVYLTPK